jgi:hypothetical protein
LTAATFPVPRESNAPRPATVAGWPPDEFGESNPTSWVALGIDEVGVED